MIPAGPVVRWVLVALIPVLVAASDPRDDVVGCRGGSATGAPDLVAARGEIFELGTSARWTLTFADPLAVPDADGRPFRIDVVLRDPEVPPFSFAFYRDVNRIVRVDATIDHTTQILLLAEDGTSVFNPATFDGDTITIQVPGRTLTDDEDLTGTSPGLEALRWSVIVRDEGACDFLGHGRPRWRLVEEPSPSPSIGSPSPARPRPVPARGSPWPLVAGFAALAVVAVAGYVVSRRSR